MILSTKPQFEPGLDDYVGSIARRLRTAVTTRGIGALAASALLATALCVYLANRAAFSDASVAGSRVFLLVVLGGVVAGLLVIPLRRFLDGRDLQLAADEAERRMPVFGGRLRTWADERFREVRLGRSRSPLLALLERDVSVTAASVPAGAVVSGAATAAFAAVAFCGAGLLVWMGTAGPGYWQYGTARLWAGWFLPQGDPLYRLEVEPGNTTIRKGGRLTVAATTEGFEPALVQIFAKFESSPDWERAPMGPRLQGAGHEFSFSAVREPLRYYVEAGRLRSPEYSVDVVSMPEVENLRLEYEYPAWSGLEPSVEDPGDDIIAVRGTRVTVLLTTDKDLDGGVLVQGDSQVRIRANRAELTVEEDSTYHIAASYRGERVRLTEDYFITAVPDEKPEVSIVHPGRDWRASGIEEVEVRIQASDDFGLRRVALHYAVNGVDGGTVSLSGRRGAKSVEGAHTFYLEELGPEGAAVSATPESGGALPPVVAEAGLMPGDLISYYVEASDAKRKTRSDMYFINVQPYERRFSQSQQSGMQGGQGQRQDEISRRQKEIILATWNLIKERDAEDGRQPDKLRESAVMLSELQGTLMQQAQTLVQRTRARQITGADPKFAKFAEFLEEAAGFMEPAAEALAAFDLEEAVPPEQQALQFLLRAENLFTDIQISMGRGGRGGGASRDLAEMFELEMDLEKNQYETGSGASGQQTDQEVDEALRKLEELARRQERLAERAQEQQRASFEQRWQQEMLRREAEDLRRELQQLQRRQQAQARRDGSSAGQQGQSGGQGAGRQLDQVIRRLDRAAREMEQGSRGGNQQSSSARAQQELQQAVDEIAQTRQRESQAALGDMTRKAEGLVRDQERAAGQMQESLRVALEALKAQGGRTSQALPTGMTREEEIDLADRKQDMGERLAEIEKGMQRQVRQLRDRSDEAAKALMDALLELQQSQAATAIQYASEMVRRGLAPYAASNEEAVSRALRALRRNLEEASGMAEGGSSGRERGLESLLSEVERLRRDLEGSAGEGGEGQQPGGRQQSRAGSREPGGEARGAAGGRSSSGARGGWANDGSLGDGRWRGGTLPRRTERPSAERMQEALESGGAEIPRLARRVGATPEFRQEDLLALRDFARGLGDGRFLGNPELVEQEYRRMMALLEQLEVQLRRRVELDDKEEVRAIVTETVPEPYREAVAEYYRTLGGLR